MDPTDADGFVSLNVRAPCEQWELAGPRFKRIRPAGPADSWQALSTSSHFAVVASSPTGAVEVEVAGPPEAELQVTALPIGDDLARIDLSVNKIHGPGGEILMRVRVNERHGVPVRLSALSWEPLTPSPNPHANEFRCGRLDMLGIAASFGTSALVGRRRAEFAAHSHARRLITHWSLGHQGHRDRPERSADRRLGRARGGDGATRGRSLNHANQLRFSVAIFRLSNPVCRMRACRIQHKWVQRCRFSMVETGL